ncbi:MAG: hypothetical protein IJ583_02355 [Firmicutes bacterium]|nr:hypothetical protein [Bacillota bacterium]
MINEAKFSGVKFGEADFIVGIDLGNATSSVSYYDHKQRMPEVLDISGGYGKASVPTAVQYLQDSGEWICGDYALLNTDRDNAVMCTDLIKGLGNNQCFIINQGAVTLSFVLGVFIRELIGGIKNVNPNVKIRGIVVSVSREMNDDAVNELMLAFKEAGYDKFVLKISSQSECMINTLLYEKKEDIKNILLLDFSDEGLRSRAYRINRNDGINAECIYNEMNIQVSTKKIENDVYKMFCELYKQDNELDNRAKDLLEGFTFEHKDLIFQKMRTGCRIYFNFAYPPIRKNLTSEMIKAVIAPTEEKISEITDNVFSRINGFDAVILSGGGFENTWSKELIEKNIQN